MAKSDKKPDDSESITGENRAIKILPVETALFVAHWAEIQQEMNKILAQEED